MDSGLSATAAPKHEHRGPADNQQQPDQHETDRIDPRLRQACCGVVVLQPADAVGGNIIELVEVPADHDRTVALERKGVEGLVDWPEEAVKKASVMTKTAMAKVMQKKASWDAPFPVQHSLGLIATGSTSMCSVFALGHNCPLPPAW